MADKVLIPLFPLRILPLPGELVPLHIFETRYKQLLEEVEANDMRFGIYFDHPLNNERIGSIMRLESVIKRYPKGELDIVVKCEDIFYLTEQYRTYPNRLYPGGEIKYWHVESEIYPTETLFTLFAEFQTKRGINHHNALFTIFQIANKLNFDFPDRYKFMTMSIDKQQMFLKQKVTYQTQLIEHEEKSRDVFHLN
jgi:uncharacterized protein